MKSQKEIMRNHLDRLRQISRPWLSYLPRYAVIGAWFFAIVSAVPLIWLMIEGHGDNGNTRVFGTTVNGVVHSVWGLSYAGFFGSVLLWLEFFALAAATVMSALPNNFKFTRPEHTRRMRRIGLGYLTGWAGLWIIGTMYLAAVDPGFWIVQAAFIAVLFACTAYRAVREWDADPAVGSAEAAQVQASSEPSAGPGPSTLTDIADIARFMLQRSAVRPSGRVKDCEIEHSNPSRLFADAKPHTALDDDYGSQLRNTLRRGFAVARTAASWAGATTLMLLGRVLPNYPRKPVEIDVAPAENHTDSLRFRRV